MAEKAADRGENPVRVPAIDKGRTPSYLSGIRAGNSKSAVL
jgi:hypothetical protein